MATNSNISIMGLKRDIEAHQGDHIEMHLTLANIDGTVLNMAGYTVNAQVRKTYSSTEVVINCTTANSRIQWINQAEGKFKLILEPAATTGIRFSSESPETWEGVYDIEINSNTDFPGVKKPWYGSFTLTREITRI